MFTQKYLPVDVITYFISALQTALKLMNEETSYEKHFENYYSVTYTISWLTNI